MTTKRTKGSAVRVGDLLGAVLVATGVRPDAGAPRRLQHRRPQPRRPITAADLTSIKTPSADDRAKGDPDGGLTGHGRRCDACRTRRQD